MAEKQKILLCGDVEGKFTTLFSRVEKIIEKSGNFDALLCVGNFFGINNKEFDFYKTGNKKVPITTYILGPNKKEQLSFYPEENIEICDNVFYLGKKGIFTTSKGVRIVYISGVHDTNSVESVTYNEKDVLELSETCIKGNAGYRGIDILLTSQWPSNMVPPNKVQEFQGKPPTNLLLDWLIMKVKPRYIISGLEGIYYEKLPFRIPNPDDTDSSLEIVTRFIGLGRVGKKEKWLYALNLVPLEDMKITELCQKTTDEIACPYNLNQLEHLVFKKTKKDHGKKQYFYDENINEKQHVNKKKRPRIEMCQSKCWFCLASPSVEKHLIIAVGKKVYLALAKGGLVEEHFLICPIEHYQSSLTQSNDVTEEMGRFKEALYKFYERNGQVPVFFERNYKTSHFQLNAVPIPKGANEGLETVFVEEAQDIGIELKSLNSQEKIEDILETGVPFFTIEFPEGVSLYTTIKGSDNFPLNFDRAVLASKHILNLPGKLEWKECILSKEDEEMLAQRLRTEFQSFGSNL